MGGSWRRVTGRINSLELSGDHTVAALGPHGALVSTDAGVTWKACGEPAPSTVWYGLAFDNSRTEGMTALAATSTGLFRSIDGCHSWVKVIGLQGAADSDTVSIVLFHPTHAGEAFAAQGGKVFRSIDQGQHWSLVDDEGRGYSWPSSLFILPEAPDRIFALFPRRGVLSNSLESYAGTAPLHNELSIVGSR